MINKKKMNTYKVEFYCDCGHGPIEGESFTSKYMKEHGGSFPLLYQVPGTIVYDYYCPLCKTTKTLDKYYPCFEYTPVEDT